MSEKSMRYDVETVVRVFHLFDDLLDVCREILECPYILDEATIPKAGISAAPKQVVGNMSKPRAPALILDCIERLSKSNAEGNSIAWFVESQYVVCAPSPIRIL